MHVAGDLCNVSDATAWRAIHSIIEKLVKYRNSIIKFPRPEEFARVAAKFKEKRGFPSVLGCIDGSHFSILVPKSDIRETFRNRKGFFSLNAQAICGPDCYVYDLVCRWPGSAHDSTIWKDSSAYHKISSPVFEGYHILGDAAYPLTTRLITPYRNPDDRSKSNLFLSIIIMKPHYKEHSTSSIPQQEWP